VIGDGVDIEEYCAWNVRRLELRPRIAVFVWKPPTGVHRANGRITEPLGQPFGGDKGIAF
jgi:hypothetical protein